jgi:hypothetical protein
VNNERGEISGFLYLVFELIIVCLILVSLIVSTKNVINPEALKRTQEVRNLGMTIASLSFLHGNFNYTYLTKENKNMYGWEGFYAGIFDSMIASSESYKSIDEFADYPEKYNFFVGSDVLTPDKGVIIEAGSVEIAKGSVFEVNDAVKDRIKGIECMGSYADYPVGAVNGGSPDRFYTADGALVESAVSDLVGFERQFFYGDERVYPGSFGRVNPSANLKESEVMKKILGSDYPVQPDALEEKHILLTVGDYDPEKSFVIAYVPYGSYEVDYGTACSLLNEFLNVDELAFSIDGTAVVPYSGKHILIEIGNINNPVLLTGNKPELIRKVFL